MGNFTPIYSPRVRRLEDRVLLNATPEAVVSDLPDDQFVNEDFQFTVTFDNVADTGDADPNDTGYGPFVDVTVGPGVEVNDVTYLGAAVQSPKIGTWDGAQWVDGAGAPITQHPLDKTGGLLEIPDGAALGLDTGAAWLNALAPFGSYTPEQPALDLVFSATMTESPDGTTPSGAVPGEDILVTARGGFQFGNDALDNPTTDAPEQQSMAQSDAVTPIIMRLDKQVQLPEAETAQGPNFTFTYTISVDVAEGVTVTDLNITDQLPDNLFFLAADAPGADTIDAPGAGEAQGVPGVDTVTEATFTYAAVTGAQGGGDIVITLTAYAPEFAADGTDLDRMDADDPAAYLATNQAEVVSATYMAPDGAMIPVDDTISDQLQDSIDITIRPYTVLKTVSVEGGGDAAPGKYLEFNVDFGVSDYLALQDGVVSDTLSDGLTLDTTDNGALDHGPVLRVEMNGETFFFQFNRIVGPGQEQELAAAFQGDGTQALSFFLGAAVGNSGAADETLYGDLFLNDGEQGPTKMTLTYYALIEESYRARPSPVVVNDTLGNTVSAALDSATSGNPAESDGSSSSADIASPDAAKSVYAVDGVIGAPAVIAPGDLVTYRLRIELATLDVNDLNITDYLPSPVYDVDGDGTGFTFVAPGGGVPGAYELTTGPDMTAPQALVGVPVLSVNGAQNTLLISYPDFSEDSGQGGVIDLLYSIPAVDTPFADGLLLVNQAVVTTGDSQVTVADTEQLTGEVTLFQPVLSLTKGAVATDADGAVDNSLAFTPDETNPNNVTFTLGAAGFTTSTPLTSDQLAATPISSDLSGIDAGDTVKFAIAVRNTGGEDAFDVVIRDVIPQFDFGGGLENAFDIPAGGALLDVRYGDGTAAAFSGDINDLFAGGIELTDAAGIGALSADGADDGRNIVIVTYELTARQPLQPDTDNRNGAVLDNYASIEGGTNFTIGVDGDFEDQVALTSQGVAVAKSLTDTDQAFTTGDDFAIGEIGTFRIEVTVPDGTTAATITDALPDGFALVAGSVVLRSSAFDGTISQAGAPLSDGALLSVTPGAGNDFIVAFDEIVAGAGAGTDLSGQRFVIEYQAQATDDPALDSGDRATNTATLETPTTAPASAAAGVDIVEPDLTITKTFTPDEAQANETVGMTLTVANGSGAFDTTSFGLTLTDDDLPRDVFSNIVNDSLTGTGNVQAQIDSGLVTVDIDNSDPGNWLITVTADPIFAIAKGEKLTLDFSLTIDPDVGLGAMVDNTATIESYSSLSGEQLIERAFGPETGSDTLTISGPTIQKYLLNTSLGGEPIAFPLPATLPVDTTGFDADPNVAVGEVLTYGLQIAFPRGVAQNVFAFDDTDFLNAIGARGIVNIVSVDQLTVGGALNLDAPLTEADVLILDPDGDNIFNRLELAIGEVNNDAGDVDPDTPVDAMAESIFIVFRAQVMNVLETDGGDVHLNGARVQYDVDDNDNGTIDAGETRTLDDQVEITVTEPAIEVAKTVTGDGPELDAGDVLTYTLTIAHDGSSTGDGYALDVSDQLPADLEFVAGSFVVTGFNAPGFDGLDTGDVSFNPGTNQVRISGFDLPRGQTVSVSYSVIVSENVVQAQALTNEVDLTYQSLPDFDPVDGYDPSRPMITNFDASLDPTDDGTYIAGSVSQTRDGSDGPPRTDPNILNNYFFETDFTVTIADPGPIVKTVDKPTATIGEIVTYTIDIPVIEGATIEPKLTERFPSGLAPDFGSVTLVDGDGNPVQLAMLGGTPGQITLIFEDFVTPGDNDPSNNFVRFTIEAQVTNASQPIGADGQITLIPVNKNGDLRTNTAIWDDAHGNEREASATFSIVEPDLVLEKTHDAPARVNAGDEIMFTVTGRHSSSSTADAFEFTFADTIPDDFFATLESAAVGGVDVLDQIEIAGNTIRTVAGADIDIPLGATFQLVYTAVVQNSVGPGETISNTAEGRWTSLDGDVNPGEPEGERDGSEAPARVNDYVASATAEILTNNDLQFTKAASVDAATIGETVTYFLDVTVFEGTLQNLVVGDLTGAGMRIDLGSLRIVNDGRFDGAAPSIVNASLSPASNVPGASALQFGLQNDASGALINPGDPIGDMTDNDTIRIAYDAVVANELVNQNGERIDNAAGVQADGTQQATGADSVAIVEPEITAVKTLLTDPADIRDAGDTASYQVVLTGAGTSDAFDVTFADTAPAGTVFTGAVTALDENGVNVGTFTVTPGAITGTIPRIAVGGTVTLTYMLTIADTVSPGDALTNAVDVQWTSTAGANPDERTGADGNTDDDFVDDGPGDSDDNLNNYQADDAVTVPLGEFPVAMVKTLLRSDIAETAGSELTIGETATYALDVTVPEGTLQNLVVVDVVEPGLDVDETSVAIDMLGFDGAAITIVSASTSIDASGATTLTIILDNSADAGNQIVNPGDAAGNTDDNDTFRITYDALASNETGNQGGVQIGNEATVGADGVTDASDDATITLVEPNLTVDKTVLTPANQISDAGDVIQYRVVIANTGDSVAFDLAFQDMAPANSEFTGPPQIVLNDAAGANFTDTAGLISGAIDSIAVGGSVTITYSIVITDAYSPGDTFTNAADVTWTSAPGGGFAGERTGADGPGPGDDGVLNNYDVEDDVTVTPARAGDDLLVTKRLEASSLAETGGNDLTVGEIATFRIRAVIPEGTTEDLRIRDFLPDGQRFVAGTLVVTFGNAAGASTLDPVATATVNANNVLTLTFGDVVNPGDNIAVNDFIDIFYDVVIEDDAAAVTDGDTLSNTVLAETGRGATDTAAAAVDIVEPDLVIDKAARLPLVAIGGTAFYQIRVDHSAASHVDAFDVVVSDAFDDPLLTLNPGSVAVSVENGAGTPVVTFSGDGFRVDLDQLELGATLVIDFTAQSVVTAGADGAVIPNTSTVDYDSIPGADTPDEQRAYADSDGASVTITGPDLELMKDASTALLLPGDLFSYDIQVLNVGVQNLDLPLVETARNVVFSDVLPRDMAILSASVDGVDTPFTFNPTTRLVTIALGNIPPDVTRTVTLHMQAAETFSPAPGGGAGDVDLVNIGAVTMRQTDPTPENNIDDALVTTRGVPDLVVEKASPFTSIGGGDVGTYTITAQNVGDRAAGDVRIVDRIDTDVFEFVSADRGGVYDAASGTVTWTLAALAPGDGIESFALRLRVLPGLPASMDETTNLVDIADDGAGGPDPTPDNNTDSETDRLIYPDLVITKSSAVTEASPGDVIDYRMTVGNVGDFRATGVTVTDVLDPAAFRFVSASDGGVFNPATNTVTWRLGVIEPGDPRVTLTLRVEALFPASGDIDTVTNAATVSTNGAAGQDADPSNNRASETDALEASPDPGELDFRRWSIFDEMDWEREDVREVAPFFTGRATPGAMVSVLLMAEDGSPVGSSSVTASADGSWSMSISGVPADMAPTSAYVTTLPSTVKHLGATDPSAILLSPIAGGPLSFERSYNLYDTADFTASSALDARIRSAEDPFAINRPRVFDAISFPTVGG